jgi:hypothetical protein
MCLMTPFPYNLRQGIESDCMLNQIETLNDGLEPKGDFYFVVNDVRRINAGD